MSAHEKNEAASKAVMLSAEEVRHAIHLLQRLTGSGTSEVDLQGIDSVDNDSRDGLLAVARFSQLARHGRTRHFSPAMFGEPAWDLLITLYVNDAEEAGSAVSVLAKDAGIPVSTALRWIDYLEEKRLVERQRSELDRRASTVRLSSNGRNRLDRYFADILTRMGSSRLQLAE